MNATPEVTHVRVEQEGDGYSLGWQCDGFRWHVWLTEQLQIRRMNGASRPPSLYKNPIAKRGEEGYFEPRRVDATNAANKPMVDAAVGVMLGHGLVAKARAAALRKEEARVAGFEAENRMARLRGAGPIMYEALTAILPLVVEWQNDPTKNWAHRQVVQAIAAARDGTAGTAHPL